MKVPRRSCPTRALTLLSVVAMCSVAGAQPVESADGWNDESLRAVKAVEPNEGPLTLAESLALALAHNPRLEIFDLEQRARDALAIQASLRPNPELALEVENFAGSGGYAGFGSSEITLSLAQLIELGGKRHKRQDVARIESELATWDYDAVRLDVFNEVTRAFLAVAAAQQQLALSEDLIDVARSDSSAVSRRVAAGAVSPIELIRARVALSTAELERDDRAIALTDARARLAATWASDSPVFSEVSGDLASIDIPPELPQLSRRLEANPDLARWQTELAQRRASLALERAQGKIDLTAAGGFRRIEESGDNAIVLGLAVPLPFSDRNQGNVRAAEYRLTQAEKERLSSLVAAKSALATSHAELASAHGAATTLQTEILPGAQEAMATAESAYLKGLFSLTDVLAVRLTYFELRGRLIASLARYHSAAADIERLVAGSLSDDGQEQERP